MGPREAQGEAVTSPLDILDEIAAIAKRADPYKHEERIAANLAVFTYVPRLIAALRWAIPTLIEAHDKDMERWLCDKVAAILRGGES